MNCIAVQKPNWGWYLVGPIAGLGALALLIIWLVLRYRHSLLRVWETMHVNSLKRK